MNTHTSIMIIKILFFGSFNDKKKQRTEENEDKKNVERENNIAE